MLCEPILTGDSIKVVKDRRTILDLEMISVTPGEVLAVIGPNGAGKSTLLSVLACLEFPFRGRVLYRGQEVTRKNALSVRRKMAVVFQEPLLLDGTALDNVALGLRLRGRGRGSRETALKWLDRFGVSGAAKQMAHTLSGGEAQRVSLARAFALEPEILFMDEPFASLDVMSRYSLMVTFKAVRTRSGTTTVFVTHDFREVAPLATRVVVLHEGRLSAEGTPDEVAGYVTGNGPTNTLPIRPLKDSGCPR